MALSDETAPATPERDNEEIVMEIEKGTASVSASEETVKWISGWRLIAIATGQALSLFMVQAESSVTSTAITAITDSLGGFEKSPWVFTAYLLTYGAFPILLAKVSDVLGRKQVLLGCLILFVIFSGACGAAQTLIQLIMFRWIQGIGSGGIVAICIGYGFELRPPEKWPSYSAFLTLTAAISVAISPLIGSAFTQAGAWRWCFLMNVPIGVTTIALLYFAMPDKLRLEPAARLTGAGVHLQRISRLRRLDFPGAFMLVGASALLTTALQQASSGNSFDSPKVLVLLILAPLFLAGFLVWQWHVSTGKWNLEPVFSWGLITNRVFMAAVGNAWLSGMVMTSTIVQIPQRFMLVNSLSAIDGGVRLLPFTAIMTSTAVVVTVIMTKTGVSVAYSLIFGALLQIAGVAGLSQASTQAGIEASQYGFQILAGAGVGIFNIILLLLTPHVVAKHDLAVGNGAINQFRILGGSHGLAIVTCATSSALRSHLLEFLSPEQTKLILDRTDQISTLPPEAQALVRQKLGSMYNTQMAILIGIAAAQVFATILQWRRKPIILKK
ncbi:major facilitator superfamily domain-containing protein [Talaromyces proteolyticus]|uniref:Major facilitator superfamily domain-containing protein n=1 Tax=Talaromyces proteolyticus TaxID=1131652 RepID=A0AAD4L1S7_9EURO|nr:major facilitator superfamily domain-containing protein [Talaromyces proteolyticus]KAH8702536.1 major facilitator superfamily domain-containing protein [Talaromyces proteolyticus]